MKQNWHRYYLNIKQQAKPYTCLQHIQLLISHACQDDLHIIPSTNFKYKSLNKDRINWRNKLNEKVRPQKVRQLHMVSL